MFKRRPAVTAILITALICVSLLLVLLLDPFNLLTKSQADRIQAGMTQYEVIHAIGRPPDFTTANVRMSWLDDHGYMVVYFDSQGLARGAVYHSRHSLFARIARRVRR